MQNLSIAIKNFNDRVKQMNQTNSRQLVLSADEARNLHSDIFAILHNISEMAIALQNSSQETGNTVVDLDGGNF